MERWAAEFLTPEEQKKVTAAVQKAEQRTSGEIVPMIVGSSGSYQMSAVYAALLVVLPVSLFCTELLTAYSYLASGAFYFFFLFTALCCSLLYYLMVKENRLTGLRRHFLFARDVDEEVERAALAAFYAEELYRTAAENGVLLYISVFEQKVWLLADRGIHEKIAASTWEDIVDQLTSAIRDGRRGEAVCQALTEIGVILQKEFPHTSDDRNELHDLILKG